jgi:hypothetical protein
MAESKTMQNKFKKSRQAALLAIVLYEIDFDACREITIASASDVQ